MKQSKVIFMIGLPGSGKSTFREDYIKTHPNEDVVTLSRDDIRTNLFGAEYHNGNFPRKDEDKVTRVFNDLYKKALREKKTVLSDNTNLNPRLLNEYIKTAREYDAVVEKEEFDVPVEECIRRNKERGAKGGRLVPEFVIRNMAKNSYSKDGHIKDFVISKNGVFLVDRNSKKMEQLKKFNEELAKKNPIKGKSVVLVDVDGTLANNEHFAQYYLNYPGRKKDFVGFYKSIAKAEPNTQVRDLANRMRNEDNLNLVVLTGRDDSYLNELLEFVDKSGLQASRVIAKRSGDYRPDGEFKAEVLDQLKTEGLVPVHAFDDRDTSIRTMEANGILVSKVDKPAFTITENDIKPPMAAPEPSVNTIYGSGYCIRCGSKLKNSNSNIGPTCKNKM